jgi:hypothetical protein
MADATSAATPLLALLPSVAGFLGGFGTAIVAEPLRQWMFRSNLNLGFDDTADCITRTPELVNGVPSEAYVIRLKVTNKSWRLARVCRAYLIGVERLMPDRNFTPTLYCDSIPLAWSVRGSHAYLPVDLPKDVPHFVDVVSSRPGSVAYSPHIEFTPLRYTSLFAEVATFRFTVRISGDGVSPATAQLVFKWTGVWDKFEAKPAI